MRCLKGDLSGKENLLYIEQKDEPDLLPDEILVKVKACAIDLSTEKKYLKLLQPSLKDCPLGHEISGEVIKVGSNVDSYKQGSEVVGVVSFLGGNSGCSDKCVLNQYDVVSKPASVSHETAAACLGIGLAAYTAIHYLGHVTAGDTVLVVDGASPFGSLSVQIALMWGAKVISTYKTQSEKQFLESMKPPVAQVIEMGQRNNILVSSVMEETGRIGVDCFIDSGVRLFTSEEDKDMMDEREKNHIPHKHDVISCLGFSSKWITSHPHLQLEPPDSEQLFLRGASVCYLCPPVWTLMRAQHGRYQHILKDLMSKLGNGELKPSEVTPVPLDKAPDVLCQNEADGIGSHNVVVVVP